MDDTARFVAVGVAVGISLAFRQWKASPNDSLPAKVAKTALPVAVAGIAAFAAAYAMQWYRASTRIDSMLAEMERVPFIGAILADQPDAKVRFRQVIQADIATGNLQNSRAFVVKLRHDFANPAIWGASNEVVLKALADMTSFAEYLQSRNIATCRQFVVSGIQNVYDLSVDERSIFAGVLQSLESVYRDGKGKPPQAKTFTPEQVEALTGIFGLTDRESESLNGKGNDGDACSAGVKIYHSKAKLKDEFQPTFARWLLSNG